MICCRYKDPRWLLGITSTAVVAPLGSVAILMSGFLATKYLDEKITRRNRRGYFLLILGVLCVLFVAPKSANALTAEELLIQMDQLTFKIYLALIITGGLVLVWDLRTEKNQRVSKYVLVSSILGSVTIMCGKATSVFLRLTIEGNSQFANLFPFLLIALLVASAVGQEYFKQQAITKYDASKFWPTFFASFNFFAVTLSLILYPHDEQNMLIFALFYSVGIMLILQGSIDTQKKFDPTGKDDPLMLSPKEVLLRVREFYKEWTAKYYGITDQHSRPE
jgi:hypothetical protein